MPLSTFNDHNEDPLTLARRSAQPRGRAIIFIALVCFGVLVATFLLYQAAQSQQAQRTEKLLNVEVQALSSAVERSINTQLTRLSSLASNIELDVPSTFSTWQALVQQTQQDSAYISSLFWADSRKEISWQTHADTSHNKPRFSFDVVGEPEGQLETDQPDLTRWRIAYPIYSHSRAAPSYYLGAVVNLDALVGEVASDYLNKHQHLTMTRWTNDTVLIGDTISPFAAVGSAPLTLAGTQPAMQLALWQEPGASQFISLPILIYIAGMLVALLLGVALYLAEVNLMSRRAAQTTIDYLKNEIEQRKDVEQQLHFIANHDALTYLPNRHALTRYIQQRVHESNAHPHDLALICVDIDNLKEINDLYGQAVHDQLLVELAQRLQRVRQTDDYIAKISDDQFAIVGSELSPLKAEIYAKQIRKAIEQPFFHDAEEIIVTCAVGISYRYDASMPAQELLRHADTAAHRARQLSHHRVVVFQMSMRDHLHQKKDTEYAIRKAIQGNELSLHFQPQIDLKDHSIAGIEALVRWQDTEGAVISPDTIVRTAEDTGLMRQLGTWVVNEALETYATLLAQHCAPPFIAINISGHEFQDSFLADTILRAIERHQVPPERVQIELTEQVFIENLSQNQHTLHTLAAAGVSLAIDDFGTGYSSLAYLKHFPVDTVKIDRSFVADLPHCKDDIVICQAVINMAQLLKLKVVAEGVEREDQRDFLFDLGCRYAQGHLYYPSMNIHQLTALLTQSQPITRLFN